MRIVWLVTAFLLALAGLARAEEMPDWSRPSVGEIAALAAMEGLIAIDAAQTVRAHKIARLRRGQSSAWTSPQYRADCHLLCGRRRRRGWTLVLAPAKGPVPRAGCRRSRGDRRRHEQRAVVRAHLDEVLDYQSAPAPMPFLTPGYRRSRY